jgi:hypothetical protein
VRVKEFTGNRFSGAIHIIKINIFVYTGADRHKNKNNDYNTTEVMIQIFIELKLNLLKKTVIEMKYFVFIRAI